MTEIDLLNPDNRIYCPHPTCYAEWKNRCNASTYESHMSSDPCKPGEYKQKQDQQLEDRLQTEFERRFAIAIKKYYDRTPVDNA